MVIENSAELKCLSFILPESKCWKKLIVIKLSFDKEGILIYLSNKINMYIFI